MEGVLSGLPGSVFYYGPAQRLGECDFIHSLLFLFFCGGGGGGVERGVRLGRRLNPLWVFVMLRYLKSFYL